MDVMSRQLQCAFQLSSARGTYNFSSCENGTFLLVEATVCSQFYYWSEIKVVQTKIILQSTFTSTIEWSLFIWNGRDSDGSVHCTIGFYCCHVTTFWLLLPTFRQRKFELAEVVRPFLLWPGNKAFKNLDTNLPFTNHCTQERLSILLLACLFARLQLRRRHCGTHVQDQSDPHFYRAVELYKTINQKVCPGDVVLENRTHLTLGARIRSYRATGYPAVVIVGDQVWMC